MCNPTGTDCQENVGLCRNGLQYVLSPSKECNVYFITPKLLLYEFNTLIIY